SFCANLVLSVPLVFTIGFLGPALGTVLAFIPMVAFYCWCIAQASSVPTRQIFPLRAFLQVAAVVLVTAIPGILFKWFVAPTLVVDLVGLAVLQRLAFGISGTLVGQITREDWRFLLSRVRRTRSPDRGKPGHRSVKARAPIVKTQARFDSARHAPVRRHTA